MRSRTDSSRASRHSRAQVLARAQARIRARARPRTRSSDRRTRLCSFICILAGAASACALDPEPRDTRRVETFFEDGRLQSSGIERRAAHGAWLQAGLWREGELLTDLYGAPDEYELAQGSYRDGLKRGTWTWTRPDGSLVRRGSFANGEQVGLWRWWHSNGALAKEGAFDDCGLDTGTWEFWHDNGQVARRGRYVDGAAIGEWRQWHPNGQLAAEGTLVPEPDELDRDPGAWVSLHDDGLRHSRREGFWREWHTNGQLASEGQWRAGRRVGRHRFWQPDGSVIDR